MARSIHLFVSSSPELVPEREALGQAVAELPVSTRWEIKHTPRTEEPSDESLAFIERCDLYLIVLGADFAAPMGLEWRLALEMKRIRTIRKHVLAYRKQVLPSPSARALLRQSDVRWTEFQSPQEFKTKVSRSLAQLMLDESERFGLHMSEIEPLLALAEAEKSDKSDKGAASLPSTSWADEQEKPTEPDRRRGAGRGGVILGRGTESRKT